MRFAFIAAHVKRWPIVVMCRVLGVSRSGYFAWRARGPSGQAQRREELVGEIRAAHSASRKTYGSPRVYQVLRSQGVRVCENTVAKLMRFAGLTGRTPRRFVPRTTDSTDTVAPAPNVLNRDFAVGPINRRWAGDITYVPTREGWLYLAAVLDLGSRRIVGWAMARSMPAALVCRALQMALTHRRPNRPLLHHSDRGSQYASEECRQLLTAHGLELSMSRRADCYDNAVMESFFATLKIELIHRQDYATSEQACQSIFEYIEVFYNRQRLHSTLGYISPETFEASLT